MAMSIRKKLLIAFMLTTLLPVLIVSAITTYNVTTQAERDFIRSSKLDISLIDHSFTTFFEMVGYNVSFMAGHPTVRATKEGAISSYFKEPKKPAEVAMASGGREKEIFELFSAIGDNNPSLGYVYMGNQEGKYLEWPGTAAYGDWDPRTRTWFTLGKNSDFEVKRIDGYYWEPDDAVYVSVLKAFKNEQNQFGGVVAIDVSVKALTDMVQNIKFGETGFIMIVEGSGNILVDAGNPKNNFKALKDFDIQYMKNLSNTESGLLELEIDGVEYMANVYQSKALGWKIVGLMQKSEVFSGASRLIWVTIVVSVILITIFLFGGIMFARRIVKPINTVKESLKTIAEGEGDLRVRLSVDSSDETGQLASWFNQFIASTQQMIDQVKINSGSISSVSSDTSSSVAKLSELSSKQLDSIAHVASAVTQMAATANEVAKNCSNTAEKSEQGMQSVRTGKSVIESNIKETQLLGQSIQDTSGDIQELGKETTKINTILDTIKDISAQTNLLALNAAIEAARAGDSGRGFAVVADEVRNLARRTADSTEEIDTILQLLNDSSNRASANMKQSLSNANEAVASSNKVIETFKDIESAVSNIRDMTTQIASAAEQQHLVTEDINSNVYAIKEAASEVAKESEEVERYSKDQARLGVELSNLVSSFKTK
jgi:methyl-accepting chemotaxis protein